MFRAGTATVDITPTDAIWLAGWAARTEPASGVSQRLWCKVLALDEGGLQAVWITSDLLGYSKGMSDAILRRLRKRFALQRAQVILNASHNHSGPVTGDLLHLYFDLSEPAAQAVERYTRWLLDRIVAAVGAALQDLSPARLAFAQGLAGFGVNRRRARDGGRSLPAVVDQDVPVLTVRAPRGRLRAVVFGYACHPTCANDGTINGDWPGYAQAELEALYPGAVAMFVAGCGGDINPLPRWRPGLEQAYGHILAVAVDQVLQDSMKPVTGPLRVDFAETVIPFETLPTRQQLEGLLPGRRGLALREVQQQLALLEGTDRRPRFARYPIHVWQIGDTFKHIALSSEPVAEYALRFKGAYGWEDVWVSGYNDEFLSYIPTLRVWREGGYEGHTGMMECNWPGPYASCIEELIAATVDELWQATSGTPRPVPRPSAHL